jgi:hypothetical protein
VKILSSVILGLMLLVLWSCSDSGEPKLEGCTNSGACNYSIENTHDDDSCTYPDPNYDCEGNCTATVDACNTCGGEIDDVSDCCQEGQVLDCAGTCDGDAVADCIGDCNGSAVEDSCGACEGDGSTCNISYSQIQEIFNENCATCHIASKRKNLSLSNYENIMSGDSNNGPVIIAGDHTNSLLWQYVNSGTMPPGNSNLTASQIDLIETWIDEGALEEPLDN